MPSFVVLGARNLGGAIVDRLLADGWSGAAIARSEDTLSAVRERGVLALEADASDPAALAGALAGAKEELGRIDLLVNAVSVGRFDPDVPFGGGPLADATLERFEAWSAAVTRQAFVFFSEAAATLEGPASLVQVANSSTRSAPAGMALWAAGWHGVRALALSAADELAPRGIDVTLLVVDGPILSPKTEGMLANVPPDRVHRQDDVAAAVARIAAGRAEPEVVLTPSA